MIFSQGDEETYIMKGLGAVKGGRLLDLGAGLVEKFSNSRTLLNMGWSGVLVEGNPFYFAHLFQEYNANPRVELVNAVIHDTTEYGVFAPWWMSPDLLSTVSDDFAKKWTERGRYRKVYCPRVTVQQILNEFGHAYRFVNIDLEGVSVAVAMQMPWDKINPEVVCVEHDGRKRDVVALFGGGYEIAYESGGNLVMHKIGV